MEVIGPEAGHLEKRGFQKLAEGHHQGEVEAEFGEGGLDLGHRDALGDMDGHAAGPRDGHEAAFGILSAASPGLRGLGEYRGALAQAPVEEGGEEFRREIGRSEEGETRLQWEEVSPLSIFFPLNSGNVPGWRDSAIPFRAASMFLISPVC